MTTTFSVDAEQIIKSALRLQGWLDYTAPLDDTKAVDMLEALNVMVKAWSSRGLKLWTIQDVDFTLVDGQASYTVGPSGDVDTDRPLRIEFALLRAVVGENDLPLNRMSREEYLLLGNKTSTGTPSSYWYDPLIPFGNLSLYVVPGAQAAADYTPHIYIRRLISDIDTISSDMEFPQEWYQALRWNLAAETSLENQIPEGVADRIELKARRFLEEMEGWDREWVDVTFGIERSAEAFE